MRGQLDTWDESPITPLSDDQIRAARLYVCEQAQGVDDARYLLDTLGLGAAS